MSVDFDTPVMIVGGGPVGFALALDLAWRGQRSLVVERDAATSTKLLAKANAVHERTMELCRRWGISDQVVAAGLSQQDMPGDTVYATSLYGHFIGRSVIPSTRERPTPDSTPEKRRRCPQYEFDPLLARAVTDRGLTEIRYDTIVEDLEQDADGVTVTVRDAVTRARSTIRAGYVVGCDGAGSTLRQRLNIPFEGRMLDFSLSAMIRIPNLDPPEQMRQGERYIFLGSEGAWCVFTWIDGQQIWRITVTGSQERLNPETFDMTAEIRRALGRDDVEFEVLQVVPWRRSECSAATYRVGRVLLAGDAAHTMSPTGGHGMNTGFGDVSDLGWMLAALSAGWGAEGLLDAYDRERRPVAIRNSRGSTANYQAWVDTSECADILELGAVGERARQDLGTRLIKDLHGEWNSLGLDLGFRYEGSPIVVPDGTAPPPDDLSDYLPTARPGHRAPHARLPDGRSTLDLYGRGFVLLRFDESAPADAELEWVATGMGVPLQVVDIAERAIADLYGRLRVLVRPDGHVAWRGDRLPMDLAALLDTVRGAHVAHD